MNSYLNEHLSGIAVVKLFSRERAAAARFESINDEHRQAFLGAVQAYAIFFPRGRVHRGARRWRCCSGTAACRSSAGR